jgi:hypothetical protein
MAFNDRNLFDDFRFDGRWWIPGNSDAAVFGTLHYKPSIGIRLELMGTIGPADIEDRVSRWANSTKWDFILGLSDEGKKCTLQAVREISGPLFPSEAGRSTLRVQRLFIGCHFETLSEVGFESVVVEFTNLEAWTGGTAFDFRVVNQGDNHTIEFLAKPTKLAECFLPTHETNIALLCGIDTKLSAGKSFEGKKRAWFQIRPKQLQPYLWYENIIWSLGSLLTLCMGDAVHPRRINGKLKPTAVDPKPGPEVEAYFSLGGAREPTDISYASMPVPMFMIANQMPDFFRSWFVLKEKIAPVIGLIAGTYHNDRMYLETEFLTLMQAFEVLHRRLVGGSYVSASEWAPSLQHLVAAIPPNLSSGHVAALKTRLKYAFEFSLRKRLELTLNKLETRTHEILTGGDKAFVDKCVDTRNGLTHEGSGVLWDAGLEELWRTNNRLRGLVTLLIWKELGLSEESIVTQIFSRVRP